MNFNPLLSTATQPDISAHISVVVTPPEGPGLTVDVLVDNRIAEGTDARAIERLSLVTGDSVQRFGTVMLRRGHCRGCRPADPGRGRGAGRTGCRHDKAAVGRRPGPHHHTTDGGYAAPDHHDRHGRDHRRRRLLASADNADPA